VSGVLQDWSANAGAGKSRTIMVLFRLAQRSGSLPGPLARAARLAYMVVTNWLLGVELPPSVEVGPGLRLIHPQAIVVNPGARIGAGCTLRNSVTIGNVVGRDGAESAPPVIGDGVEIGSGALVIGPIAIGDGARIGAGAVVVRDVPAGATAVGNPARLLDR
jgi:putative colanic acid biosynthesis acetyltransferase WcaB